MHPLVKCTLTAHAHRKFNHTNPSFSGLVVSVKRRSSAEDSLSTVLRQIPGSSAQAMERDWADFG